MGHVNKTVSGNLQHPAFPPFATDGVVLTTALVLKGYRCIRQCSVASLTFFHFFVKNEKDHDIHMKASCGGATIGADRT